MSCQSPTGTISYQSGSIILCAQNLEKKSARNKKGITHPDPFNSKTTIRFKVSHDSRVTVTVHNILGQEITKEVFDTEGNTELSYQLEATRLHLASGMYIVTATATDHHGGYIGSHSVKVQLVK